MDERITRSAQETIAAGKSFAMALRKSSVIGLVGPLGSGKTQFVKGICEGLRVRGEVLSPSFVLMHRYEGTLPDGSDTIINHLDFYRITKADELDEIGFREIVGGDAVSLVEWADAFRELMPEHTAIVTFAHGDDPDERVIRIPRPKGPEA